MKRIALSLLAAIALASSAQAQQVQLYPERTTFWNQRNTLFQLLPVDSTHIVMLGNSITNGSEWFELFNNPKVINRGISGDMTAGILDRLDNVLSGHPAKIFLMIGVNDFSRQLPQDTIVERMQQIIDVIRTQSPRTKLYIESVLPMSTHYGMFGGHTARNNEVPQINARYKELAEANGVTYVDLWSSFVDPETGEMRLDLSNDGLHLLGTGYLLWRDILMPYINE